MMNEQTYPLTMGQKVIGFAGRLFPQSAVNNIGGLLLLEDELDFELLEKTLHLCIQRNDALRLRMLRTDETLSLIEEYFLLNTIRQYVCEETPAPIKFVDFSGKTEAEMDAELLEWNSRPIDIYRQPLYEFTMIKSWDGRCGVFSKIDHLATDAWMSILLCTEMIEIYYALKRGEALPLPAYSYIDYIAAEEAYMASKKFEADESYWMSVYGTKPPLTYIYENRKYPFSPDGHTNRKTVQLDSDVSAAIRDFCTRFSVSPSTLFTTVFGIYLYKFNGSPDVAFCSPTLLRSTLKEKRTCGALVNNLNVRLLFDESLPFHEICLHAGSDLLNMMRHMQYPQLYLMMQVYTKYEIESMWDAGIAYHASRVQIHENVKFQTKWYSSGSFSLPLYMNVTDFDDTGRYLLYYEYQVAAFSNARVDEIHRSVMAIIERGISKPDTILKMI